MLDSLPSNTDFYSTEPRPYPGATLAPAADPAGRLLPLPREIRFSGGRIELESRRDLPGRTIASVERLASGPAVSPLRLALTSPDDDLEKRLDRAHAAVPGNIEGYSIAPLESRLVLAARTTTGLLRGTATLEQLASPCEGGRVTVPLVHLMDFPATQIRFLGGWALWRAHGLREAIDIASAFKANRVLYNAWGWTPADRLSVEDAWLVEYAREQGIELVFELRRMSFGREHPIADPANRQTIIEAYCQASDAGFRSFGLLFDDAPWETADDECALAVDVHEALEARLGGWKGSTELFVCPQFYWYPGQMDSAWKGRAGPEETARQRAYLETYGRRLPPAVHVYVANFWGDHPAGYEEALRAKLTELVGRQPIFFDNQIINDYRHGALFPFALHSRPGSFGSNYAGYYLNCGRPLAAYAASAATALAFAWSPEAYRPEVAMGAALRWLHSPSEARAAHAAGGLNRLRTLASEWAGGTYTAVSHYATLWRQIREGKVDAKAIARWTEAVHAVREDWLAALREPAPGASPRSLESLLALVRDSHRLERDLELFAAYFDCRGLVGRAPSSIAAFETRSREITADALLSVASILPPAPGLAPLLDDPGSVNPRQAQAWSWVEYFHANTRKTLETVASEMLAALRRLQ